NHSIMVTKSGNFKIFIEYFDKKKKDGNGDISFSLGEDGKVVMESDSVIMRLTKSDVKNIIKLLYDLYKEMR
ncbi:hypothetical protein DRH14_02440, partial [Candidatus Shapirobacteria bacterium]